MKNLTLIICCIFSSYFSNAQNLVPNWSFEDTVTCPFGLTQIFLADGWSSWRNTPDLFHTCATGQAGVPNNFAGFQTPKTGQAYAGFLTYAKSATNGREVFGIELIQPLIVGEKYFLSFYVSNAINPANYVNGASNKTGVRLSTIEYSQTNVVPIDNYTHIYTDSIITDSIGWVKIAGSFIADSAYKYMAIGNFFTDSACSHIYYDSSATFIYYYIDDIKLSNDSSFVNSSENIYETDQIKIFPNPARDWIAVEGREIKSIEVLDLYGRIILPKIAVFSLRTNVDISSLSYGIYFIKINTKRTSFIKKIIHN